MEDVQSRRRARGVYAIQWSVVASLPKTNMYLRSVRDDNRLPDLKNRAAWTAYGRHAFFTLLARGLDQIGNDRTIQRLLDGYSSSVPSRSVKSPPRNRTEPKCGYCNDRAEIARGEDNARFVDAVGKSCIAVNGRAF